MYYVANWKMNGRRADVLPYLHAIQNSESNVIVALPHTLLRDAENQGIALAGQNMCYVEKGAYTGETSAQMLKDVGCSYVILGHSERRTLFFETNEHIAQKMALAFEHDLIPILCVGETLAEKESDLTKTVLENQLDLCLKNVDRKFFLLAYEPVWSIGTGLVPEISDINDVIVFLKTKLKALGFENTCILYGGSVTPGNVDLLKTCGSIDGFLVGGASMQAESFLNIIKG